MRVKMAKVAEMGEAEAVEAEAAGAEAGPFDRVQPGFVPSGCASDLT